MHRALPLVLLALAGCGTEITAPDDSDEMTGDERDTENGPLVLDTGDAASDDDANDDSANPANEDDALADDDAIGDDGDALADDDEPADDADDDTLADDDAIEDDDIADDDDVADDVDDEEPVDDDVQQCTTWEQCGPYPGDLNSGFECVDQACVCDPVGQWSSTCANAGGYFVDQECLCVFASSAPPGDPSDGCYWHWHEDPCDPDQWVDTSYYDQVCTTDANGDEDCYWEYVEDGYYEDGACPAPYWEERC